MLIGVFVFLVDPFQHFRASELYPADYNDKVRYLVPGFAKHQSYELIILGDSHSQNMLASVAQRTLGKPAVNLSLNGSSVFEQRVVAETALRTGQVKRVIWGLNYNSFRGSTQWSRLTQGLPMYLYDESLLNDVDYLFNADVLQSAFEILSDPEKARDSPDLINSWFRNPEYQPDRDKVIREFRRKGQVYNANYRLSKLAANLKQNVIPIIRAHPEVEFTFFVPPFSVLHYVNLRDHARHMLGTLLQFYEIMFDHLTREPNVTLYFFGLDKSISHKLENYKDLTHYSLDISTMLLEEFARKRYMVTRGNMARIVPAFDRQIQTLDVPAFIGEAP
ncbi:MAG: hypothetical protein ACE5FN_03585 [Leptospirillia bacterium]